MKIISETLERSVKLRSFVPLLLISILVGSAEIQAQESGAQESGVRDKLFRIEDWSGYNLVTTLDDGTSLFSYVAETANLPVKIGAGDANEVGENISDRAEHNVIFRITFFARFQCSPLIEVIGSMPENTNEGTRVEVLRNFNQVGLSIDGENLDFPVFVEQRDKDVHSFYNANLEGRTTMRILLEIGDNATMTYGDGTRASFSLLGSRKAIAQATGRCRSHQ